MSQDFADRAKQAWNNTLRQLLPFLATARVYPLRRRRAGFCAACFGRSPVQGPVEGRFRGIDVMTQGHAWRVAGPFRHRHNPATGLLLAESVADGRASV